MSAACATLAASTALVLAVTAVPVRATAQTPGSDAAVPRTERRVAGRIVRPKGHDLAPVAGAWATIHRVGRDSAGPLDSTLTARDGRYAFRYRPFGSDEAIYFVSAVYGGIAYFTPPLSSANVTGEAAEITVFDTTSRPVPIHVRGHHLVVSAPRADARREVLEVFELTNDSSVTLLAAGDTGETFSAPIASSAGDFRMGTGDVTTEATTLSRGRLRVLAPFAPGEKQISYSYTLPAKAFPLRVLVERATVVLEALVEDPRGSATGAGLAEVTPVTTEGRTFRRFQSDDVPAGSVLTIDLPPAPGRVGGSYLAAVAIAVGAAMLVALARAFRRREGAPVTPITRTPAPDTAQALARVIADLDTSFERVGAPTDAQREEYQRARSELKARLSAALAREGVAR